MATKTAVVYYSATGGVRELAQSVAEGARDAGAEVRLLRVREFPPDEATASNRGWSVRRLETHCEPEATLADLERADVLIFGTPSRFGLPAAQLKRFLDAAGHLWAAGKLRDKFVSSFASAAASHGGQETTIVALNNVFYHWGSIIVPAGYEEPGQLAAGNPYGASFTSHSGLAPAHERALASARRQGRRTVDVATRFMAGTAKDEASIHRDEGTSVPDYSRSNWYEGLTPPASRRA